MNKTEENLILALETGIGGGSIAVVRGKKVLCRAEGTGNVSKSEDLLLLLEELLRKNGLKKQGIGAVVISDLPGSLTGIRIGLATALGLADSLSARVFRLSILEAQVIISDPKRPVVSAIYAGKTGVYYRKFNYRDGKYTPETEILNERAPQTFAEMLAADEDCAYVLDKELSAMLQDFTNSGKNFKERELAVTGETLAISLGLALDTTASDNETRDNCAL